MRNDARTLTNTLALGPEGALWNDIPLTTDEVEMYLDVMWKMRPAPALQFKIDPRSDCSVLMSLIDLTKLCTPERCAAIWDRVTSDMPRFIRM
ncbi:MAG: hypothetical protein ABIO43_01440 [Sphingomicrobium sp.]